MADGRGADWREGELAKSIPNSAVDGPTVVDLFCGAGGLSLGLQQAGFAIRAAFDNWLPAVKTYRLNFQDHVSCVDITEDLEVPEADVIVGGPPCQGFSSAGLRRSDDHRNTLVAVFAKIVARVRPLAFVFENVEGFLTGADGHFILDLLQPVIEAGYRVHVRKVNAANYGVPQHRKRVVAIGGLGWDPPFPESTHSAYGAPGAKLGGRHLPAAPCTGEVLTGLPPAERRRDPKDLRDHVFTPLAADDLERAKLLAPGERMRDLPEELWHPSYRRRAYRRVMDGTPSERRGGAPAGVRRLRDDEPSKAITGGAVNEFLHPTEDRPLTVRECARIQTFPDDFNFVGTFREVVQLIGNAVPVHFAWCVGESLRQGLMEATPGLLPGALLTFVPTLSAGKSPALEAVERKVLRRFLRSDAEAQACFQWD
jgi:DNA (cytosine-5)-methyltransferase 1